MDDHFSKDLIDDIDINPDNNYFTPIINHVFKKYNPRDICDIGCGNGKFTGNLKKTFNCNLTGVDGSKYALQKSKEFMFDNLVHVKDFSNDNINLSSENFDLVICKDVFEHLINPNHLTKEIFRILKPGGFLVAHVPNHFPIWGRTKFFFNNKIDTFNYFPNNQRYDFPHIRFFNLKSFEKMFLQNKLYLIENLSFNFFRFPILDRFLSKRITKFMCEISTDNFSEGITLILKKK